MAEQVIRPTGLIDPPIEVRRHPLAIEISPTTSQKPGCRCDEEIIIAAQKKNGEQVIINALTKKIAEKLAEFY